MSSRHFAVRSAKVAAVATGLGIGCIALSALLPAFEPCRVFYYVRNPILDSAMCQSFMALAYAGLTLLVVGAISAIVAAFFAIKQRWPVSNA